MKISDFDRERALQTVRDAVSEAVDEIIKWRDDITKAEIREEVLKAVAEFYGKRLEKL